MNTLTTTTTSHPCGTISVFWLLGKLKKGCLDVVVDFSAPEIEKPIIAELIAIQHLLLNKTILGGMPKSGNSFGLVVSKGAIKKYAQRRAQPAFAGKFAGFLTGRLAGASIRVSHKTTLISMVYDDEKSTREVLHVTDPEMYSGCQELVETPTIGPVWITRHAVERYIERNNGSKGQTIKNPWESLVSRIKNNSLERTAFNESVSKYKQARYLNTETEVWSHPSDSLRFVIAVQPNGNKRLVTVFDRDEKYW